MNSRKMRRHRAGANVVRSRIAMAEAFAVLIFERKAVM
jgi:hypothetical protein